MSTVIMDGVNLSLGQLTPGFDIDYLVDALRDSFPSTFLTVLAWLCLAGIIFGLWLIISKDQERTDFRQAWMDLPLDEKQVSLDQILVKHDSPVWRRLVEELQDMLDCDVLGVGLADLPRARVAQESVRLGVPVFYKDSAAQIYEKIRLAQISELRKNERLLLPESE